MTSHFQDGSISRKASSPPPVTWLACCTRYVYTWQYSTGCGKKSNPLSYFANF